MEAAAFIQRFYQLTPKPKAVLIAFLEGAEDEAIAVQLKLSTATVRKHIQNLCDHFAIAAEGELGKQNRRQALFDLGQDILQTWLVSKNPETLHQSALAASPGSEKLPKASLPNRNNVPQVGEIWGREMEQAVLKTWLTNPDLRLGIVSGLPGGGKTSLVARAIAAVADQFDWIIWRSLSPPVTFSQWLDECLSQTEQRPVDLLGNLDQQFEPLLNLLRQKRCLLIFDDWHNLFAPHQYAGHYQGIYQDYQTLLEQIVQTSQQSLVLIISQTLPARINRYLRPGMPVENLTLGGMGKEGLLMLQNLGLTGESVWPDLLQNCGDRPLSLLLVNGVAQSLFAGNVENYLKFNPLGITEDHFDLLQQSLTSLTPIEQQILTIIALAENPISLEQISAQVSLSPLGLLAALTSLDHRHLLQKSGHLFSLEAAISNGLLSISVKQIWQELMQLLQDNSLIKPSYWVEYDLTGLFSDPQSHPKFQQLWRIYRQEHFSPALTIPPECPVVLGREIGYFSKNWQALVTSTKS